MPRTKSRLIVATIYLVLPLMFFFQMLFQALEGDSEFLRFAVAINPLFLITQAPKLVT